MQADLVEKYLQGDFEKKGSYKFRNAEGWQAHSVACIGFQLYNAQCTCMQTPWFPGAGRWGGRSFRLQAMPGLGFIHIGFLGVFLACRRDLLQAPGHFPQRGADMLGSQVLSFGFWLFTSETKVGGSTGMSRRASGATVWCAWKAGDL